jgi:hypothetical protein
VDSVETLTAATHIEDEMDFFSFVLNESPVKGILSSMNMNGPTILSLDDIEWIRRFGTADQREIFLWNTSCPNPLCWSPDWAWYDANWEPIERSEGSHLKQKFPSPWLPRTTEQGIKMHTSFQDTPITETLFMHGRIARGISPVIEISLPLNEGDYFGMTADFYEKIITDVWLEWDTTQSCWRHEQIKAKLRWNSVRKQSHVYLEWQQTIYDWARNHWGKWIIPRFTYRLGSSRQAADQSAQFLADLMGENVAGFEPRPPTISPREKRSKDH